MSIEELVRKKTLHVGTGCLIWMGNHDYQNYAVARSGSTKIRVHRHMYEKKHGPLPASFDVHHKCGVKSCINVDHLQAMSRAEHASIGFNSQKTKCKKGHDLEEIYNTGVRGCRICRKAASKRYEVKRTMARRLKCKVSERTLP